MLNSTNQDQDQRRNANMEDSTMTIDFLRARLLSERSVSSSARQRAEELAKRVVELEEQLKIVSLQRKKAEKATTDLLAILETNGISDVSGEEYDSRSDQEGSISDSRFDKNSGEEDEASPNEKVRSSSNGRSLSWKSKNSSLSTDKKIYSRRRRGSSSLVSAGSSSAQHTARSCRQIRRSETRSAMDELQIDTSILAVRNNKEAACTECFPKSLVTGADTSRVGSEDCEEKDLVDSTKKNTDSHYFNQNFVNMESALEHQARLIGKYQSEENAQREWEEKFGENNSCTPDSLDAGNQSDVTEERDEIKASVPPSTNENQSNAELADAHFPKKEPEDQSPVPEFTSSKSKNESNKEESLPGSQGSSRVGSDSNLQKGTEASGSMKELTLVQHGSSSNLESVLKALNQAKLSLKQDLNITPSLGGRAIIQAPPPPDEFSVQRLNGLFRVPTDFQHTEARLRYSTEPDHATSYMQSNLNTGPYLSVQPFRYPDFRTPVAERSLPSSGRYPHLEPPLITSLPSRFDPRLDLNVPSSSLRLNNLLTFDRGLDSGRSPYYDRRLTSTTSFDPGLGLGEPSSGIPPYVENRLSSIISLPSTRYDPASDLGVPYSGRSLYLGHDLSTNLPSRGIEPSLDLRMYSNTRYSTYQDPRLNVVTGAPSSSRYSTDRSQLAMQSDNRTLTSREDRMMPPAAAAAEEFSFYDQDNSNTPNMYR